MSFAALGNIGSDSNSLTANSIPPLSNVNALGIYGGQLYASTSANTTANTYKGIDAVGTGLPTAGDQIVTRLPGLTDTSNPNSYSFFFAKLGTSGDAEDTLYVADPSTGISKFSLVGGTWVSNGTFGGPSDTYRGLAATVTGTTVTLYATRKGGTTSAGGGELVSLVDSTGFSGNSINFAPSSTLLATAASQQSFRGVAIAPTIIPNNAPTINSLNNTAPIPPNSPPQIIALTGISDGDDGTQVVTITATSNNPALIPNPSITYTNQNPTGTLTFQPVPGRSGTALITVTVMDDGNTLNGGQNTATASFTVTISPNNAPTIDPIINPVTLNNNFTIPANPPSSPITNSVNLTHITDGDGNVQNLTVTASSSNTTLIPTPVIIYTPNNTTGTLTYSASPNQTGTATITVTVTDDGGTGLGGVNTTTTTFTVTVIANHAPTINTIANPATIPVNSGLQSIPLSGISDGDNGTQIVTITATSSNTAVIPNPNVSYSNPSATGTLSYTPVPGASGTAIITVTVQDNGGTFGGGNDTTTKTFVVSVSNNLVNHAPTINPIPDPASIPANSRPQTIQLSGISDGDNGTQIVIDQRHQQQHGADPQPERHLLQPGRDRLAHLHPGAQPGRHRDDHRHRDRQRRHCQ